MHCRNQGCEGEYERRNILHLMRGRGQPIAVADVPAEVCSFCGDTFFDDATLRRLEAIRQTPPAPSGAIPIYVFAEPSAEPFAEPFIENTAPVSNEVAQAAV